MLTFFRPWREAGGLDRFAQQSLILAGQTVRFAKRVEAVAKQILVDRGRERANLFEAIGRRHRDAAIGAQPAQIVDAVQSDDARL